MQLSGFERYILSACMIDRHAARQVVTEITDSAFAYGADDTPSVGHKLIYRAIVAVHLDGHVPDVATVSAKLGTDLDLVGGMAYLTKLTRALAEAGIHSTAGLPEWAGVIDKAGRLRAMSSIFSRNLDEISDIERAMDRVENVDRFLSDVLGDLAGANTIKQEYRPISEAVGIARDIIKRQAKGETVGWFPMGWPSFEEYRFLPRRALFVLLGLTSIGKSQMLAQMILGAAIQLRYNNLPGICVVNTYEMAGYQYILRMASCIAEVDLLSPPVQDETSPQYHKLMEALDFVGSLPIMVSDGDMGSAAIVNNVRLLEAEHGAVDVVGIDYAELVPDQNKKSEEQRVTGIFRNAQVLSRATNACVIMLSQFPQEVYRDPHKLGIGINPRYSGAGMHAAHIQAIIYNPPQMRNQHIEFTLPEGMEADFAYLVVTKNKDGKVGHIRLGWKPCYTRFTDPALAGYGQTYLYENIRAVQQMINVTPKGDF